VKPAPRCGRCPVAALCEARRLGRERELPPARRRAVRLRQRLGLAIIRRGARLLLQRRPAPGLFGGLWSPPLAVLPSGRLPPATAREALQDRLSRQLGVPVEAGPELARVARTLTHRELELVAIEARAGRLAAGPSLRWVGPEEVASLAIPSAVRAVLVSLPGPGSVQAAEKAGVGLAKRGASSTLRLPSRPIRPSRASRA
jgi:A/G-specific adenine glycosylase